MMIIGVHRCSSGRGTGNATTTERFIVPSLSKVWVAAGTSVGAAEGAVEGAVMVTEGAATTPSGRPYRKSQGECLELSRVPCLWYRSIVSRLASNCLPPWSLPVPGLTPRPPSWTELHTEHDRPTVLTE